MTEEEDRKAVTALVKADLVDDALDRLSWNIAGDLDGYETHIGLFVRRLITALSKYATPKSKAYFYDIMTKD